LVFGWLKKRDGNITPDVAQGYLSALSGSDEAVIVQVLDWVNAQVEQGSLDLTLLQMADQRLDALRAQVREQAYLQSRLGTGYRLLRTNSEQFAQAYLRIARGLPEGSSERVSAYLRAACLFSRACYMARMTYGDPGDLRKALLGVWQEAERQGIATRRMPPYPGLLESSVIQEVAVSFLFETAPFENLSVAQIEYLARFLAFYGNRIVITPAPGVTLPYAIVADGQVCATDNATLDPSPPLFIGPGPLLDFMANVTKLSGQDSLPPWAGDLLPYADIQTIKSLAQRLCATWEKKSAQRSSERQRRDDNVRVTGGFINIRRAVAYAAYVRNGGKLDVFGMPDKLISERLREIMVGLAEESKERTPVEVLAVMEGAQDQGSVEEWSVIDNSATGYSLVVPGFRKWLAVGGLLALRESDQIDWHIAIVRRLYGMASSRRVGIEIFPGTPVPIGVGVGGQLTDVSIANLRDAILINGADETWVVTSFPCVIDATYLIASQQGRQLFKIRARYGGDDGYEVYTATRLAG
jgi:hypothetical protein